MADSIETLHAAIALELREIEHLIEERGRLQIQISELASKIVELIFPRWDYEVLRGMAEEWGIMAQLNKDEKAVTETVQDISSRLAQARAESSELSAKLAAILQTTREARELEQASIKKLRGVVAQFEELLDQATPKA